MNQPARTSPPRIIDPDKHGRALAALGRSQELMRQLLDIAVFECADPNLGGLRQTIEAHLRYVRDRLNSQPSTGA